MNDTACRQHPRRGISTSEWDEKGREIAKPTVEILGISKHIQKNYNHQSIVLFNFHSRLRWGKAAATEEYSFVLRKPLQNLPQSIERSITKFTKLFYSELTENLLTTHESTLSMLENNHIAAKTTSIGEKYHFSWSLMKRGVELWVMELWVLKLSSRWWECLWVEMRVSTSRWVERRNYRARWFSAPFNGDEEWRNFFSFERRATSSTCKRWGRGMKIEIMQIAAWSELRDTEEKIYR